MKSVRIATALAVVVLACACAPGTTELAYAPGWRELEPGLELGVFDPPRAPVTPGTRINVVRIDTLRFELRLLNASAPDQGESLSAREWCEQEELVAAINASMYQEDYLTSVSLMRRRDHVNNGHLTRHRAVLAFDRNDDDVPPVRILDLECEAFDDWKDRYGSFVQSIRMLSCDGRNVWAPQSESWSTAAIGTDGAGRVLLIHVRAPYRTHELIDVLVELPLGLERLMYAEGGPQAQLYVRSRGESHEFVGGFGAAFDPTDAGSYGFPLPNVVGVVRAGRLPGDVR